MAYEKQYKLMDSIISKTLKNELNWEQTLNEDTFEVSLDSYSIKLAKESNFNNVTLYTISILNNHGQLLERFTDEDLDAEREVFRPLTPAYYRDLEEVFSKIKRTALGVEQALDSILEELNSK